MKKNISISFVIPVYNEEKRIEKTIKALKKGFNFEPLKLEKVIFVNDGSKDNTVSTIKPFVKGLEKVLKAKVEIISYSKNRGKGFAIKTGMLKANSDYNLFFDADMATPLDQIKKFIPFMEQGKDVIIGTRKNGHSTVINHQPLYRELLGKCFTLLSNVALNTWVTDFTCGFKAFSREAKNEVFKRSKIDRWSYDAEIMFLSRKLGYTIQEKAVTWSDDRNTKVKILKSIYTSLKELMQIRFYQINGQYAGLEIGKQTIKGLQNIIESIYVPIGNLKLSRKA